MSDEFKVKYKKLQHRKTGEIITIGDFREGHGWEWKTLVDWTYRNPSKFFSPFAAYIVPKDLKSGERVIINDVIPAVLATLAHFARKPVAFSVEVTQYQVPNREWGGGELRQNILGLVLPMLLWHGVL